MTWCNSYRHVSICVNFSFSFLKKVVRDQRWPTAPFFVANISPSLGEFTAPLRYILPIHNVTINSNNLFADFRWTFNFCVEKSYDGTYLASGGTLDRRCHFKHVSLKQSRFYHCQRTRLTGKGSRSTAVLHNKHKKFPYRPTRDVPLLSGHTSYLMFIYYAEIRNSYVAGV